MIWLALLLTASLAAPSVTSGDGQPPVTIIEIPVATTTVTTSFEILVATTTVTTSSVVPPETSVLTTSPAPATSSPQIADQVSSTVRWPFRLWVAVVAVAVGGLLVLTLVRRNRLPGDSAPSTISVPSPPPAVSPSVLGHYEAVEYRSESGTSEVEPRRLGEFGTLEAAIETARLARSWFVLNSRTEAFWVVWNLQLKRAAWIAESGTPGESVIDLRTGRRQPYIAQSAAAPFP
ncbi:hypothetical protein BH18ACT5_BH18ACT5_11850 [soil metagenome]